MEHPKFRAAYDLLALRAEVENNAELLRLSQWWGEFQSAVPTQQKTMLNTLGDDPARAVNHAVHAVVLLARDSNHSAS